MTFRLVRGNLDKSTSEAAARQPSRSSRPSLLVIFKFVKFCDPASNQKEEEEEATIEFKFEILFSRGKCVLSGCKQSCALKFLERRRRRFKTRRRRHSRHASLWQSRCFVLNCLVAEYFISKTSFPCENAQFSVELIFCVANWGTISMKAAKPP